MEFSDTQRAIMKLFRKAAIIHYSGELDPIRILNGEFSAYLPLLKWVIMNFSKPLYEHLMESKYTRYNTELELTQNIFYIITNVYKYVPEIDIHTFLTERGNALQKCMFTLQFIEHSKIKHNELLMKKKLYSNMITSNVQ